MQKELILLAVIGFIISLYAVYVEKKSKQKNYKPLCDINDKISCTKALNSHYGKLFKIKNSIFGIIFYLVVIILALINQIQIIFYLSIIAVLGSIYLAYISYFKLETLCIVCNLIYLINVLLLILSYL